MSSVRNYAVWLEQCPHQQSTRVHLRRPLDHDKPKIYHGSAVAHLGACALRYIAINVYLIGRLRTVQTACADTRTTLACLYVEETRIMFHSLSRLVDNRFAVFFQDLSFSYKPIHQSILKVSDKRREKTRLSKSFLSVIWRLLRN